MILFNKVQVCALYRYQVLSSDLLVDVLAFASDSISTHAYFCLILLFLGYL